MSIRRLAPLAATMCLLAVVYGCSKSGDGGSNGPTPLPQEIADDLMQTFAMTFATVRGGWLIDIESSAQSTPLSPAAGGLRVMVPAAAGRPWIARTQRDTMFMIADMSYNYTYIYTDSLPGGVIRDTLTQWNPAVYQIDGRGLGTGTIVIDTTFAATYQHVCEEIIVRGVKQGELKLRYRGVGDETIYASFRPAIRGGSHVFYNVTGFGEYDDVDYYRNLANPNPLEGLVTVFMFADRLRSANPADIADVWEAEIKVAFDSTETPMATISEQFDDPAPNFRYRINLRTGQIIRI